MIRISVVSYLNSRPFVYGLTQFRFSEEVSFSLDIPSVCANKLINGGADIGLVPVAAIPSIRNAQVISDYCIGAEGEVRSVLLLSDVPVDQINTVLLDYQSRTSVMLARILFEKHWKLKPAFTNAGEGYEDKISGNVAGVVIGDRALLLRKKFKYVYDLPAEWKKMTSLPFVFACWVCTSDPGQKFITEFNNALSAGLNNIDAVIANENIQGLSNDEIGNYLKHSISYHLDDEKKKALELFMKLVLSTKY